MSQVEFKVSIKFWETNSNDEGVINQKHTDSLRESAMNSVMEMVQHDYIEGQLNETIEGVEYRGHWKIKTIQE